MVNTCYFKRRLLVRTKHERIENPNGLVIRMLGGKEISYEEFLAAVKKGDYFLLFWKDFGEDKKRQTRCSFFEFDRYDANGRCLIGKLCESMRSFDDPIKDEVFFNELEQIQAGTGERATILIKYLYQEIKNLRNRLNRIKMRAEEFLK